MKLEHLTIENFRGIEHLELSFLDEVGLPRDISIVAGPNTSGKTTILDAIALCLMPVTSGYRPRGGLSMTASSLVRSGAARARVEARVWFDDDEIQATRDVMERSGNPFARSLPNENLIEVSWEFPDDQGGDQTGHIRCNPPNGWHLFQGRRVLAKFLHVPELGPKLFERLGGLVMFDQQRTGLSMHVAPREQAVLGDLLVSDQNGVMRKDDATGRSVESDARRDVLTKNPRTILTTLAFRALLPQTSKATEKEDFARLKTLYEHVCRPHRIGDLINTEHGLDMEFWDDRGKYLYDGLSGGQEMILLMLLQFATERIHRSIVLIDELELHLHPLWQDRLLVSLPKLGEDNQFFITTHSTHIRDTTDPKSHFRTGDLSVGVGAPAGIHGAESDG